MPGNPAAGEEAGDVFGTPEESITAAKKTHLVASAQHYRASHPDCRKYDA
jgi:Holliday junction resolvase-like predicted endonuclease